MISQEQIKEWNDYFNSLSPAQKRVAIAKDVIANILADKFSPKKGDYVILRGSYQNDDTDVQSHFDQVDCNVCALGACLLSLIKYTNDAVFDDVSQMDCISNLWNRLAEYFSLQQIFLIEHIFEKWWKTRDMEELEYSENKRGVALSMGYIHTDEDKNLIVNGRHPYVRLTSHDRLIKIMQNIIDNDGEFVLIAQ